MGLDYRIRVRVRGQVIGPALVSIGIAWASVRKNNLGGGSPGIAAGTSCSKVASGPGFKEASKTPLRRVD